ncbi:winged helix-turn-helix transcriptional regulator [Leucobacter chinensis]|uniref:winged helix-turn-helix transcriptional regulator n=1 Tax=Leucobacter chinensis TaxID=2851010 RepID=UPI001C2411C4|nr:helix-turn-helix domain-containing protein [Leucobacter chinensis]
MQWLNYDASNCSVKRALEMVGEKWTLLILREAFNGIHRFDEIRDHLGVSDSVLADRLHKLVTAGILHAVEYQEPGMRARREYELTPKGSDLFPVIIALLTWGDKYYADEAGPAITVTHRGCGSPLSSAVQCENGHTIAAAHEGKAAPGPGALISGSAETRAADAAAVQ